MDAISELLDRLTRPLRVDRELQAEVRRELQSHLQDAIAENRSAGMNDEEAQAQAVRALGDEKRLCDQLWQANRRRIRMRSWLRWGIGLIALPAAAVMAIVVGSSVLLAVSWFGCFGSSATVIPLSGLGEEHVQRLVDHMPPDDRLLFQSQQSTMQQRIRHARLAQERWPEDPMLRANLLQAELSARRDGRTDKVNVNDPEPLLRLCDAGRQAEPDNGFYPLLKSAILLAGSSERQSADDGPLDQIGVVVNDMGRPSRNEFTRYVIHDAERFREGLSLFHEAAGKPYIKDYSMALAKRRLRLLGEPRDLNDVLQGTAFSISVLLPNLSHIRNAADAVTSASVYPRLTAIVGDGDLAAPANSIRDVYHVGELIMQNSRETGTLVELMVGIGIADLAIAHAVYDKESSHPGLRAESLRRYHDELDAQKQKARMVGSDGQFLTFGAILKMVTPVSLRVSQTEIRGGRQAEYAMLDSAFVALTMLLLLTLGVLAMAPAAGLRLAGRDAYVPLLSWRAMARSIGPAVIAPIAGIAALTFFPWTNRRYGLLSSAGVPFVQYIMLLGIMLLLLRHSLLRELRAKGLRTGSSSWRDWVLPGLLCLALAGLSLASIPASDDTPMVVTGGLALLIGIVIMLVLAIQFVPLPRFSWERRVGAPGWLACGSFVAFVICGLVGLYISLSDRSVLAMAFAIGGLLGALMVPGLWLADHFSIARPVRFSLTSVAALGPVCILTALAMGLISLPLLKWQEHKGVSAMLAGRSYLMENEVQRSGFNDVAQWLQSHPAPLERSQAE